MSSVTTWLRPMTGRDPGEDHRASTPLELLFDLCFVVAVSQAAAALHHGIIEDHLALGLRGYLFTFFAIWWAWLNFTWFASAYDTDDVPYRLLTLLQIAGVLVLAAGVPSAFGGDARTVVAGYIIMRVAMVAQWLRAARSDPAGRPAALRYAAGVVVLQVGWTLWLLVPSGLPTAIAFVVLAVGEMAVPIWAEARGARTTWHPGHIAERYGLFTLIVLGECVLGATVAVQTGISEEGLSLPLVVLALGGLLLVFGMWWSYFKHDAAEALDGSLQTAVLWGYGHYLVFASVAAVGAGLEAAVEAVGHHAEVGEVAAGLAIAVPVSVFVVVGSFLQGRLSGTGALPLALAAAAAVVLLVLAAAAHILTLPVAVVLMGLVLGALLAANLLHARRAGLALS